MAALSGIHLSNTDFIQILSADLIAWANTHTSARLTYHSHFYLYSFTVKHLTV